jgi:hypothetical protein
MKTDPDAALQKISDWLAELYGPRLQTLVAYGSAAGGNHRHSRSDINLLAVLDHLDAATLDQGTEALRWWTKQGNPPVVLLSRAEQDATAALFPIEYLDIQAHHRVLRGEELFAAPPHAPQAHRQAVERELRSKLLRLRGAYTSVAGDAKKMEAVLHDSASAILTLFRHALVVVGEPLRLHKDEVLAAAAGRFGFAPEPLQDILHARRTGGRIAGGKREAVGSVFAAYLDAVQAVERAVREYDGPQHAHVEHSNS